jgi:hypothetical protein
MAASKIIIEGLEISVKQVDESDFISLTDISRRRSDREPSEIIRSWLRNGNTLLFLEAWEQAFNPDFKPGQMDRFKSMSLDNRSVISAKNYLELTGAIGIQSKPGRYGGTFAHVDIAFEFATWLDPVFKVFLIKDYQRLKAAEAKQLSQEWNLNRFLSKVNYRLQAETIKTNLLPRLDPAVEKASYLYANEADLLNLAVFGLTAKQWRESQPEEARRGNMRDAASTEELTVMANLEAINSLLIEKGATKEARLQVLCTEAARQLAIFRQDPRLEG